MSYSIDSMKVRIPTSSCTDIHPNINSPWYLVNSETGEAINKDEKNYTHSGYGVTTRFSIERQVTADRSVKEFLTFVITSKMIGKDYYKGITYESIGDVYDYIQSLSLASFTLDTFLQSECTDIDIKRDFNNDHGPKLVGELLTRAKMIKEGRGATKFKKKLNQGIQFASRETTSFATAPYLKIYSKWCDMNSKSKEFAQHFEITTDNKKWRVETTLKNRQHLRKHGITDSTVANLVSLAQEKYEQIMTTALRAHFEPTVRSAPSTKTSALDQVITNLITSHISTGKTIGEVERIVVQHLEGSNKSKWKRRIKDLYTEHILPTPDGTNSDKLHRALEGIGLNF